MRTIFSLFSVMIVGFLSSNVTVAASSKNQFSSSAIYAFFEHKNEGYRTTEKGWLPGINLSLSHTNNQMRGVVSTDIYAGDVQFAVNSDNSKTRTITNEEIFRLSYRLESTKPTELFQFYGMGSLQRWNREILSTGNVSGIDRKYEWWTIEAGIQANIIKSTANLFHINFGLTRSLFNKIQINLRQQNLGKPLLKPAEEFGITTSINYVHLLKRRSGIKISADARYWRFGEATKSINLQGQKTEITELASESLLLATNLTYFVQF